jgi:hypothetical protein
MTERTSHEVETLTIRIPTRLQRRGGRKLIVTPEGMTVPAPKPSRDPDQSAGEGTSLAAADRERAGEIHHGPRGA